MHTINLTDDQLHWLQVALDNSLESARRIAESSDLDDQLDAGLLIQRYTELQEVIGEPPPISL